MNFNAKPKFRWPAKFILISSLQRKFTTSSPFKDKVRQSTLTQAAALSVLQERHHCAQLAKLPHTISRSLPPSALRDDGQHQPGTRLQPGPFFLFLKDEGKGMADSLLLNNC